MNISILRLSFAAAVVAFLAFAGYVALSGHAFAEETFRLARASGARLAVERVLPIPASEYPTPACRPANSRLDLSRLRERYGLVPPDWRTALAENFALLKLFWEHEQAAIR